MTRRGRRRLLALLLILGGLVTALLAAPLLLDHERYRGMLTSRLSLLLGRKVTASRLTLHLLPTPGATIRGLTIADRVPWSGPFVEAEGLEVALKPLALLKGELQVRSIRIDRPRIRVARGPDGWNIEDLVRPAPRAAVAEPRRPEGPRVVKGQPALPILVAGALAIQHGALRLENPFQAYGPTMLEFKDLNVDAPTSPPGGPFRIHVSGSLPGHVAGTFDLTGRMRPDAGDRSPIEVELAVRGLEAAHLASYLGLSPSAPSLSAWSGTLDLEAKAVGEWPHLAVQADVDLQRVGVGLPPSKHAGTGGEETGKVHGDKAWLRAEGRWEGERLDLSSVSLRWKGQTITGRLSLLQDTSPHISFELNTPDFAIEPIVAITSALSSTTAESGAPRTSHPLPPRSRIDLGTSRTDPRSWKGGGDAGLRVEGRLRSGVLRWGKLALTSAEGDLRYCCGLLTIHHFRGRLYGGTLSGDAALSFSGQASRASITTHLEGVQTEPLLQAIQEPQLTLRGIMTLDSKMELPGLPGPGLLARASGQTDVTVTRGRVIGYPPLERLSQTVDPILRGAGLSTTLNEFDRLSAHWTVDGGILRTRDLTLLREGAKMFAAGSINLLTQALDFDVTARVAKTTLEAKVQGTSSDPVVIPQGAQIERRVKTEVGRLLRDDGDKALGKVLRELFNR